MSFNIIRKIMKEVLDYDEKKAVKSAKTSFFLTPEEPISAVKEVNIDNSKIKISFFIDENDDSLEISFTDDSGTFTLTNKNNIAKVLSTVHFQFKKFLDELNKKMLSKKEKIVIRKLVIHPTKIKGKDDNKSALNSSRGKIFNVYIQKTLPNTKSIDSQNKITYILAQPFRFGFNKDQIYLG